MYKGYIEDNKLNLADLKLKEGYEDTTIAVDITSGKRNKKSIDFVVTKYIYSPAIFIVRLEIIINEKLYVISLFLNYFPQRLIKIYCRKILKNSIIRNFKVFILGTLNMK